MAPSETPASSVIATLWSTRPSSSERQGQGEVVSAHPAVFLGKREAEQAQFAHLTENLVRELVIVVALSGGRRDDLVSEIAHRILQRAALGSGNS